MSLVCFIVIISLNDTPPRQGHFPDSSSFDALFRLLSPTALHALRKRGGDDLFVRVRQGAGVFSPGEVLSFLLFFPIGSFSPLFLFFLTIYEVRNVIVPT